MRLSKKQTSLLTRLLVCMTLLLTLIGAMFSLPSFGKGNISASAETVDITDTIGLGYLPGYSGANTEIVFGIQNGAEFVKSHTSTTGVWNFGYSNYQTANGGVDILEYICINDEPIRTAITNNEQGKTTYKGDAGWLGNGGICAPVFVESTNSDGVFIRIYTGYSGEKFTVTFKSGFSLLDSNGNTVSLNKTVKFGFDLANSGTISKDIQKDTVDVTETVRIEFSGYNAVQSTFKIFINPADSLCVNNAWNIQGWDTALIAANNGVDIMEYIYVNGENIRDLSDNNRTNNTYPVGSATGWLTNSDQCRPVFVETNSEGIWVTVLHSFSSANYTVTLKKGFSILDANGCVSAINEDVTFNCTTGGGVTKDVTETVRIEFSGYNAVQSTFKIFINPADSLCVNSAWNIQGWDTALIAANSGVDIMKYIYVNGENIRDLSDNNRTNNTYPVGSATGWLTNSDQCRPVFVETNAEGIWVTVLHSFSSENYKVTLKKGFSILDASGCVSVINEDVTFNCTTGGGVEKVTSFTLLFDGVDTSKALKDGDVIGELPAVPPKDGYEGAWTIDGVIITADTVYNYGADKKAVVRYTKDVTDTITIEFSTHTTVQSTFKIFINPANSLCANSAWNIQGWDATLIAANNGVDIMEYIHVNDENIRDLSDNNRANNTYPVGSATGWLTNSDQCRPVFVETNSEGIWVTVLHAFSSEDYKVTLKAGFAVLDSNGSTSFIDEDVEFLCTAGGGVTKVQEYTLSFEGLEEPLTVMSGQPIGQLPAVPPKDGCEGVWTIDGVEITKDTIYSYGANKTAVAVYSADITRYIALENRTSWGACAQGGEAYFGVLDMRDGNVTVDGKGVAVKYLNSNNTGTWYHGNNVPIEANNGIDIMEYIYINDKSARSLLTENNNGSKLVNGCTCWLSNPAASPVYVETTAASGIMIKVLQAYVGNYFEITFKAGFSLINDQNVRVYLTKDVTYKYIASADGQAENATFAKGEITDAELDVLGGKEVTLMNGNGVYLDKTTKRLTLPEIAPQIVENGLSQVLVGWTTDPNGLSNLYPVGHKLEIAEAMTLYAVWIGFELEEGASVRLTNDSHGIRFTTHIDAGGYKLGVEKGLILGAGTFLVPTDYLETGVAFVHDSFGEGYYMDKATKEWKENGENASTWTYAAAFVGISEKQYARQFSARGYLKVQFTTGEGYVYTPYNAENNARSIYEVAVSAYMDEEKPHYKTNATIQKYVNKVANVTWNDNYTFEATDNVPGNYEITDFAIEGSTVTVYVNGDVSSAVINGKRLSAGATSNVKMGEFILSVSGFTSTDDGFTFNLGAAKKDYSKQSDETLRFESSDADLDFFLNDYFKRHSGYVENGERPKVNSTVAGVNSEEFFSQEWMSMSYYWYNSFDGYTDEAGNNENRIAGLRNFLSNVPVDDYGYVWSSNDRVRDANTDISAGEQKMGWPFPNNETLGTAHWEFNSRSVDGWTNNISASASGGLYGQNLSNRSSNITFTSKSFSTSTSKKIYTFYAPLLEFEVRIDDASSIEDIYVWYTTSASTSFNEDKKVSVKNRAFLSYNLGNCTGEYNHVLYLPMYAEANWGESTSTYVKQLRIEIALKDGQTLSGYVGLNYVRPTLDTRMTNNNSIFISSLRQDYDYTGDLEFLKENITRARKAMRFLLLMYDSTRKLKKESYLVGHGGKKEALSGSSWFGYSATDKSIASSISQGYWDIMYMPEYDFQSNVYFYKALVDMAYLEDVLGSITGVQIKTATRGGSYGTADYNAGFLRKTSLKTYANNVLTALRATTEDTNHTGFWNAEQGRFVAGYASDEGKWYDYGYVAWNLEAIYYGVADDNQAKAIMKWLSNEEDLYDYVFAPRSNTIEGTDMLNGEYAAMKGEWDFGDNCQYGGAIMYTSFYDLMARINVNGADNAFTRLTAIQNWYKEVYDYYVANGTDPYDFYRYYYDSKGITCQGMGTAGSVGLDREFLESFLPVSAVAYGFFGIDSIDGKTLEIAPELPGALDYWKMENLAFNFVKYDLKIYEKAIQLSDVRGDAEGLTLQVALKYTEGEKVYVNGAEVEPTKVENGKAYVTVAFGPVVVEVK